jgi:hypothetical protein
LLTALKFLIPNTIEYSLPISVSKYGDVNANWKPLDSFCLKMATKCLKKFHIIYICDPMNLHKTRVVDPDSINTDPDPAFLLKPDPDPVPDPS